MVQLRILGRPLHPRPTRTHQLPRRLPPRFRIAVTLTQDVCCGQAAAMDPRFKPVPGRARGGPRADVRVHLPMEGLDFPARQPAWGQGSPRGLSSGGTTPDTPGGRSSRTVSVQQERLDALYYQQQNILVQQKQHQEQTRDREERDLQARLQSFPGHFGQSGPGHFGLASEFNLPPAAALAEEARKRNLVAEFRSSRTNAIDTL
ncbi:hypothetical protein T484DRAFT_1943478 [Baffinella frigidus]|nr:hypothetical protein T484DRAFT_1943478 [Cryptophyta sp. CCMP2293]